jgi:hypothetical protein
MGGELEMREIEIVIGGWDWDIDRWMAGVKC